MRELACGPCPFANQGERACQPLDEQWATLGGAVDTEVARCAFDRLAETRYDDLTGLYTYKTFHQKLEQTFEHERASDIHVVTTPEGQEIRQRPGGFIFVDGEHVKELNEMETVGHDEVDKGLIGIGQVLRDTLRDGDLFCRRSGDEFVIFLPGNTTAVTAVAERLREALDQGVPLRDGHILRARLHLEKENHIESYEQALTMIQKADRELGKHKRGRNVHPPLLHGRRRFGSFLLSRFMPHNTVNSHL